MCRNLFLCAYGRIPCVGSVRCVDLYMYSSTSHTLITRPFLDLTSDSRLLSHINSRCRSDLVRNEDRNISASTIAHSATTDTENTSLREIVSHPMQIYEPYSSLSSILLRTYQLATPISSAFDLCDGTCTHVQVCAKLYTVHTYVSAADCSLLAHSFQLRFQSSIGFRNLAQ